MTHEVNTGTGSPLTVTGLGQCSLDYIALVDGYPIEDTKVEVRNLVIQGGGPVATALVSLSRLGVETRYLGRISDDEAGKEIQRGLIEEGVGVQGLKTLPGGKSQMAFIVVNTETGSRTILWQKPTVAPLGSEEVDPGLIKGSQMLLLDGLMVGASQEAARLAREHHVPVMLDAGRRRPGMMKLAGLADYIVCSEEFSREAGNTPEETLKELASLNPTAATVTLGQRGSVTWHRGKTFQTLAFEVQAVDTTGAGDVFHGGYIYGLIKGWDIEETVRFASAFAALKCTRPGGRTGIPTLAETLKFINN